MVHNPIQMECELGQKIKKHQEDSQLHTQSGAETRAVALMTNSSSGYQYNESKHL